MAKYQIGDTPFEADNLVDAIAYIKSKGLSGKMVRVNSGDTAPTKIDGDRIVTVSCVSWTQEDAKWVRHAHTWTALKSEVMGQQRCPDHRNS